MAVVEKCEDGYIYIEQRNKFSVGDTLEALEFGKKPVSFVVTEIINADGEKVESAPHAMMKAMLKSDFVFPQGTLLRKQAD